MKTGGRTAPPAWIGLILAVLVLPIALSGATLVGGKTLDRLLHPDRHAISGNRLLPADLFVDLARREMPPGTRVAGLTLPKPGDAVVVAAMPPVAGAWGTDYYLDPPTGRLIAVAARGCDLVCVLRLLHHGLGLGPAGRGIVGALGVALMLNCLTGLYIGWPYGGGWRQVSRYRWRRDALADGHHLLGLVTVGPVFLIALSGTWLVRPASFERLAGEPRAAWSAPVIARPMARPAQPLTVVLGRAADLHPDAAVRMIAWPTERDPDWTVRFADPQIAAVKVADDTGDATAVSARRGDAASDRMRDLHDGAWMGSIGRGVLVLTGLLYAAMTITGLMLWRRARRRRDDEAATMIDV